MMTNDRIVETARKISALENHFIMHERFGPLEARFTMLAEKRLADIAMKRGTEAQGLALSGASGTGKSEAMSHLLSRARERLDQADHADLTIVSLRVPSPATLKLVGLSLLRALGFPISAERQAWYIWDLVRHHLRERKVIFVHLDEAQDLASRGTKHELNAVSAMLKTLMTDADWPVSIVLSGTTELEDILNHDPQLARRMKTIYFGPLSGIGHADDVLDLLEHYCERGGLTLDDDTATAELAERLIHGAANQFGLVIELTLAAIEQAYLKDESALFLRHFAEAYAERSGSDDAFNPFIIPDYHRVDARQVYAREHH